MSDEDVRTIRRWHDAAYAEMMARPAGRVSYLGLELDVPAEVFAPAPLSQLLGTALLAEVTAVDRVLDMGTGCGVNAILAASASSDVVGVDINPHAVQAAMANAELNGVAGRTRFLVSDVFGSVEGRFDLIVFDPPFRWFAPRDWLETAMADDGYEALTRFMEQAQFHLTPTGRMLMFFGSSGDLAYFRDLTERVGFESETLATRDLTKDGVTVSYYAFRLTARHR